MNRKSLMKSFYIYYLAIFLFFTAALLACESTNIDDSFPPQNKTLAYSKSKSDVMNQNPPPEADPPSAEKTLLAKQQNIPLPFANGITADCADEFNESYDLDFSFSEPMEIFAPIAGVISVQKNPNDAFGKHINISFGDGSYLVIGGLLNIFPPNNTYVVAGELLATIDCDSDRCLNHIYFGAHEGDFEQSASMGIPIDITYFTDPLSPTENSLRSSKELVCSDRKKTFSMMSNLPIALNHPDGTLVYSEKDSQIFLITNGKRRAFYENQFLTSYSYKESDAVLVSQQELKCTTEDQPIFEEGFVGAITDQKGTVWLVVGSPTQWSRYRIKVPTIGMIEILKSWGLDYNESKLPMVVPDNHTFLKNYYVKKGVSRFRRGTLLSEKSSETVYVVANSTAMQIRDWETFIKLGYQWTKIMIVEDGLIKSVQKSKGDCVKNEYCIDQTSISVCNPDQALSKDDEI